MTTARARPHRSARPRVHTPGRPPWARGGFASPDFVAEGVPARWVNVTVAQPDGIRVRQDFPRELTLLREQAGLTIREFADKAGIEGTRSTIGDCSQGVDYRRWPRGTCLCGCTRSAVRTTTPRCSGSCRRGHECGEPPARRHTDRNRTENWLSSRPRTPSGSSAVTRPSSSSSTGSPHPAVFR